MGALALLRLIALAAAAAPGLAAAHHADPSEPLALAWNLAPEVAIPIVASALLYAIGVKRLWSRAGVGRGISRLDVVRFAAGWALLVVALVSPLDALGERLFSAHMVQHELLMAVAAPFLVLGRPLEAWTWAMPAAWRAPLAAAGRVPWLARPWAVVTDPLGAWTFHAAALWAWHVPLLFDAALRHPALHALQHAFFLGSALAFWWTVFGRGTRRADGASLAGLFGTMMHSGGLGALLTFAPTAWYAYPEAGIRTYFLSPLEDQQLGGLVMWGPGGLAYLVAGLAILATLMRRGTAAAVR